MNEMMAPTGESDAAGPPDAVDALGEAGSEILLLRASAGDAALDLAVTEALLERGRSGGPAVLRVYRPVPTVAFGRLDTHRPGFAAAARAARAHGFEPVLRGPGGRAAAYGAEAVVVDHVGRDPEPREGITRRFAAAASMAVDALRALGIAAAVAELPGEYCPGAYSIAGLSAGSIAGPSAPDPRRVKLGGTAQRVVRGAWLVGVSLVVGRSAAVRGVLEEVYACLGYELDPATVGAADDLVPGLAAADVERALLDAYGRRFTLHPADDAAAADGLREEARRLVSAHRLPEA